LVQRNHWRSHYDIWTICIFFLCCVAYQLKRAFSKGVITPLGVIAILVWSNDDETEPDVKKSDFKGPFYLSVFGNFIFEIAMFVTAVALIGAALFEAIAHYFGLY